MDPMDGPNSPGTLGYVVELPIDRHVLTPLIDAGPIMTAPSPIRSGGRRIVALVVAAVAIVAAAVVLGVKSATPKRIGGQAATPSQQLIDASRKQQIYLLDEAHPNASVSQSFIIDEAVYNQTLSATWLGPNSLKFSDVVTTAGPVRSENPALAPADNRLYDASGKTLLQGHGQDLGCGPKGDTINKVADTTVGNTPHRVNPGRYTVTGYVVDQSHVVGTNVDGKFCEKVPNGNGLTLEFDFR